MAEETRKSLITTINGWPRSRKLTMAVAALASVAIFAVIILQAQVADYKLLFANLGSSDASSVVGWLKERKIPYRLEDEGKAIYIPADQVHETRLELAGAGLPQGGGVGFEVFDKQSFGMTDFAQKINYQRALQGELARTIASLAPVEGARVHLALAEKRLFREQQKDSTASVILKLAPGASLKESQIQGIIHLVAGSIEGIEADKVTVVDATGRILSQPPRDELAGPMTPGMLDHQQTLERRLEGRAQALLDRALGPGSALVKVTANLDFTQQEQTEEKYDPEGSVVRSEQSAQEKGASSVAGGIPGAQSNLPDGQGGATTTQNPSSRNEETVNYEVSKVVSRKVFQVGTIKQLSVAVLIADKVAPGAPGEPPVTTPRNEKELQSIEELVRNAIGLDAGRGDQITVNSMPFENIFSAEPIPEVSGVDDLYSYLPFVKYGLLVVAGLLLYFLLARPMLRTLQREAQVVTPMKTVGELEMELNGEAPEEDTKALANPNLDLGKRLRKQAIQERAPYAQIIKRWLREG
ncbi:flagellar M-ring protein [Desulfuromonas versatilis]|uniref:Flagellar M-ring protein n=1 Tax=Desulfuromonas versatilis TaxID=2802975 RepID=A0ABN6E2S2_9BACT|nr:flagellar basal-body MS-ring/collar protein FliF [Desulfuromonas versatilis]BCR06638.1 flagellar M-ring protein [Desulfuromonas versatilis]